MTQTNLVQRTKLFWDWFSENEEQLAAFVENRRPDQSQRNQIVQFISEGVAHIHKDLTFNIGGDYEFTFAIGGNGALYFILPYVIATMPKQHKDKWKFFAGLQGTGEETFTFAMHGTSVDTDKVMVLPIPTKTVKEDGSESEQADTADLFFYAKEWEDLKDEECYHAFWLLFENTVGEALASIYVAEARRADAASSDMIPLSELRQWMLDNLIEEGKTPNPADRIFSYGRDPEESSELRQDILVGTGKFAPLVGDYYEGQCQAYQNFIEFGAKPIYLHYYYRIHETDSGDLDSDAILAERYDLTDKIEAEILGKRDSGDEIGIVLGGALGRHRAYIDLLLYDEGAFIERARNVLAKDSNTFFMKEFRPVGSDQLLSDADMDGFMDRLQTLYEVEAHGIIVEILEGIGVDQLDYDMRAQYSRALNNVGRLEDALEVMEHDRKQGRAEIRWNYRYGYSLLYLDRFAEAEDYFQRALDLGADADNHDKEGAAWLAENKEHAEWFLAEAQKGKKKAGKKPFWKK